MSSTDKEKGMIKEWAGRGRGRLEGFDVERESFWNSYEAEGDIVEYDFETVPELRERFEETLKGCKDVILPMCVAAFKKKDQSGVKFESDMKDTDSKDFLIPEFIYVF